MNRGICIALLCLTFADASWAEQTSLCKTEEDSIVWCETGTERIEYCASKNLSASEGYMQLRAGEGGRVSIQFPEHPVHPRGIFVLAKRPERVVLVFQNVGTTFGIGESMLGEIKIYEAGGGEREGMSEVLAFPCERGSGTLTLTPTLERFKEIGIYE